MQNLVLGLEIAMLFVGGIIGGITLGFFIDKHLNLFPWGIISGVIGGVVIAFFAVYQKLK